MTPCTRSLRPREFILLVSLLVALIIPGCSTASQTHTAINLLTPAPMPADAIQNQLPGKAPDVANGAKVYARKCLACHGETGLGNGPRAADVASQGGQVARLADPALLRSAKPGDWFDVVSNGRMDKLMPGFAQSLPVQDRWDVLSYLWALGTTTQTVQTGHELYAAQCESCHGATGKGDGPQASGAKIPSLADVTYLAGNSLADVSTDMVKGEVHKEVKLDEAQRQSVADYVRTFTYHYADTASLESTALAGNGILRFESQNLTPNGPRVKELPVTLHAYDTSGEVFSRTAKLDMTGVVTFTNLSEDAGYFYQADAVYSGAKYFAAPQQFSGTLMLTATLPIYEVTRDPGVISVSEYHYFVQAVGEGKVTVVEFYVFDNASDRAYVAEPGPGGQLRSLKLSVPDQATNLRFDGPGLGARFFQDGATLFDSDAVPPGQGTSTIAMIYDLPYHGGMQVQRQMPYAVKTWDVLLPDNALRVTGMTDKGLQVMQSGNVRLYVPDQPAVLTGSTATFGIMGQPRGTPVPGDDGRAVGFGLVSVALAAGLGYFLISRLRQVRVAGDELVPVRQTLLQQIADLDSSYAAGQVAEPDYTKKRNELKQELLKIWE